MAEPRKRGRDGDNQPSTSAVPVSAAAAAPSEPTFDNEPTSTARPAGAANDMMFEAGLKRGDDEEEEEEEEAEEEEEEATHEEEEEEEVYGELFPDAAPDCKRGHSSRSSRIRDDIQLGHRFVDVDCMVL
jgi:hypothetical protein